MANREEMAQALREKSTASVHVNGRDVFSVKGLPRESRDGPPVEGIIMHRDARLTREGMEHVLRSGGAVLFNDGTDNGEVITRLDDLPDEAECAAADERKAAVHAASIDARIDQLVLERARVTAAAEKAREAKAAAPPDEPKKSKRQRKKADAPEADAPDAGDEDGGEGEGAEGGTPRE